MALIAAKDSLLGDRLAQIQREVDSMFDALLPEPQDARGRLFAAMRYAAIGGGKRLRPLLLTATADMYGCLLYTSPSPRDRQKSRMPSSA